MKKYNRERTQQPGLKAPTRDIAIANNEDGARYVVNRDQVVIIPYFRDTDSVFMISASFNEWLKEADADGQSLVFPYGLFWDSAFTEDSVIQAMADHGIVIKKASGLYQGPVMQRGMEQSGRIKYYLADLGWWDYTETTHLENPDTVVQVQVEDLPHIEFKDLSTAFAARWCVEVIQTHGLSHKDLTS